MSPQHTSNLFLQGGLLQAIRLLLLLSTLPGRLTITHALERADLFPFGMSVSDTMVFRSDDDSVEICTEVAYNFFGDEFSCLTVSLTSCLSKLL